MKRALDGLSYIGNQKKKQSSFVQMVSSVNHIKQYINGNRKRGENMIKSNNGEVLLQGNGLEIITDYMTI